jgi:hypothetical protein
VSVAAFHFGFEALVLGLEEQGFFLALSQPKFESSILVLQGFKVVELGMRGRSGSGGKRWDGKGFSLSNCVGDGVGCVVGRTKRAQGQVRKG